MKRDGALMSLWQHRVDDLTHDVQWDPAQTFDVVIVGGGMTGITTAIQLQKMGKKCIVAEAYNLCFGTTGGTTAHLNTFLDNPYDQIISDFGEEGAQQVAHATKQALALVKENVSTYNIECGHAEKNGYVYAQTDEQVKQLDKALDGALKAGVNVAYSATIPVPVEFKKAMVFPGQAQFHPTQYVLALAKAFIAAGGVILENCFVDKVHEKSPLIVETSKGIIKAEKLVYATHVPPGINLLHFRNAPYRSYVIAVTLKSGDYPTDLAYDMYEPYHYYRTQEVHGEQYLIVGGDDHKTAHETNTEKCFLSLESYVRKYFDIDKVAYRWSSQYFDPSDGLPYIGHLPGASDNIYVATGYAGNGMTYSHVAAITLTELITKGQSKLGDIFKPARIKPVAGFTTFVEENLDVVKEFFTKRFNQQELPSLSGLAPNDATVVKYEGQSIAIYKNNTGKLYAVNPVCTHAKCIVGWNRAEQTWDCPCHGARYDVDGKVLTGPARKALEVVSLEELAKK